MVVLIIALKTGMLDYIFSILLKYYVDKVILKKIKIPVSEVSRARLDEQEIKNFP